MKQEKKMLSNVGSKQTNKIFDETNITHTHNNKKKQAEIYHRKESNNTFGNVLHNFFSQKKTRKKQKKIDEIMVKYDGDYQVKNIKQHRIDTPKELI